MQATCGSCGSVFEAKTSRATYCGVTCRSRAARQRKAAEAHQVEEVKTGTDAEHELVKAVRTELGEKAATFAGQLAMQLARRLVDLSESGTTALSKELRAVMAEALAATSTPAAAADAEGGESDDDADGAEDDEVARARRQRAEAREAAGLA